MPGNIQTARPGGDDLPFVYSGSLVVKGQAITQALTTGVRTEMGKIGKALQVLEPEETNLQVQTGKIVRNFAIAGLLAGAISMALGEWLSVQSSRELYQHQISIEKAEIAAAPEELALIYEARGIPVEDARKLAQHVVSDPANALETLAREELNVDPAELGGSAWEAAFTSFFLFALGAIIPVFPFIFLNGLPAVVVSMVLSAVGLFIIGGGITLFTGRSVWFSGSRQVLFGLAAAAITFGIGRLIGVNLAG